MNKLITMLLAGAAIFASGGAAIVDAEPQQFFIEQNGQKTPIAVVPGTTVENLSDILGNAENFGVVANTWNFNGEAETSAAVKHFVHQWDGGGGQTGVTDKAAGSDYGFSVVGQIDNSVMIKGVSETIATPKNEQNKFINSTNGGKLVFANCDNEKIDAYVDNMLSHATSESTRLAQQDSIQDYNAFPGNQMTLDVTSYGEKTVYINVNKSSGLTNKLKESSGVTIRKNKDQMLVFNFTDRDVYLNKIEIEQGGQKYGGDALANQSTRDNPIARDLIFNMPETTHAELHNITGTVIAPKATIETYDVTGGWIIADTFANHCEHHFTNGELPDSIVLPNDDQPVPTATPSVTPQPSQNPESGAQSTATPSETPQSTAKPTQEANPTQTPETKPNEKPTSSATSTPTQKPENTPESTSTPSPMNPGILKIHAVIHKDDDVFPEENLEFEIKKTSYGIPEKEQNDSDKQDNRESHDTEEGTRKNVTTNENGHTDVKLDKGSYIVITKRKDSSGELKEEQTTVYVHSDGTITGERVKDETFEVQKVIKTPIPSETPEDKSSETPEATTKPEEDKPVETPKATEQPKDDNHSNTPAPTATPSEQPEATPASTTTPTATTTPSAKPEESSKPVETTKANTDSTRNTTEAAEKPKKETTTTPAATQKTKVGQESSAAAAIENNEARAINTGISNNVLGHAITMIAGILAVISLVFIRRKQ